MMRTRFGLVIGIAAFLLPAAAHAACEPSLVDTVASVPIVLAPSFEAERVTERINVDIRNNGSDACVLRLAVGRETATSDPRFPPFTLTGPSGVVLVGDSAGAMSNPNASTQITIAGGAKISIPYEVSFGAGWDLQAGNYEQYLIFQLFEPDAPTELASHRTRLDLEIPAMARIRFAGASGAQGPAKIEMGDLSPVAPTSSPPFAIRVFSTSVYRMEFSSQNNGTLLRVGGSERIPYHLSVDGRPLNLNAASDGVDVTSHPGPAGSVHPLSIVIDPDPTRHAGTYNDRVTITVTPI
ncbi:hypothetical protein ACVENA_00700 [Sphingopyxis sp. 550A]